MTFIDTHTHLFLDAFDEDRKSAVQRALDAGIEYLLLPNVDTATIEPMNALCREFPGNCFPMMGLHPGAVDQGWEENLEIIRTHLFSEKEYIAVGEIGMDLYWDTTYLQEQREVFRRQVEWAKELRLPIVIHAREAFDEIFEVIDQLNSHELRGVFHCFTGTREQADHIRSYGGFKLGIGGVVTYKKSGLAEVLGELTLSDLVLETDSPYLPPVPFRGQRNESAYLRKVAEKVAEVFGTTEEEVARITTLNALELFDRIPSVNKEHHSLNGTEPDRQK